MCIRFLYEEMLIEKREFYSFYSGINFDSWLAKPINALSAPSNVGIYVLQRCSNLWRPWYSHVTLICLDTTLITSVIVALVAAMAQQIDVLNQSSLGNIY